MLEFAPFAKIFATGPDDPLSNRYCFYCMLCKTNISIKTRGLYELKRHFLPDCHFRADQRLREKICPGKVRGRDRRVLYESELEAERELYMELDLPDILHNRPFYSDVLEGKTFTFITEEARMGTQNSLLSFFSEMWGTTLAFRRILDSSGSSDRSFSVDCGF